MFQKDSKKVRWVVPEGLSLLIKVCYEMMCWYGCLLIYFVKLLAFWLAEKAGYVTLVVHVKKKFGRILSESGVSDMCLTVSKYVKLCDIKWQCQTSAPIWHYSDNFYADNKCQIQGDLTCQLTKKTVRIWRFLTGIRHFFTVSIHTFLCYDSLIFVDFLHFFYLFGLFVFPSVFYWYIS